MGCPSSWKHPELCFISPTPRIRLQASLFVCSDACKGSPGGAGREGAFIGAVGKLGEQKCRFWKQQNVGLAARVPGSFYYKINAI